MRENPENVQLEQWPLLSWLGRQTWMTEPVKFQAKPGMKNLHGRYRIQQTLECT